MSFIENHQPGGLPEPARVFRKLPWDSIATLLCSMLFCLMEIAVVAAAFTWAVAGLLHLGAELTWMLSTVIGLPTVWLGFRLVRHADQVERSYLAEPAPSGDENT